MKHALLILCSFFLCGLVPATAQDMMTLRRVTLLDDDKPSLTSDKKDKLSMSITGRGFVGSVFLDAMTPVKVISRQTYTQRESVGVQAKAVNRTYTVGLIEVLDGANKGVKGWAVIEVQDEGARKDAYIGPGRAPSANSGASASGADASNSVDLVVSVGAGHVSPTSGRLYEVGVVNKGGVTHKGSVEVVVEIDGKVVKTERLRGPIAPNQAVSFTLPVSDTDLRKRVKITATVDPKNQVPEGNEGNNTATVTASP